MSVVRPRRGMLLSLFGMGELRGRLGPRIILSTTPFSIVERVTLRSPIASRSFVVKSSALPTRTEGISMVAANAHPIVAAQHVASEQHSRGEWILMTDVPHVAMAPDDEAGFVTFTQKLAEFHIVTRAFPVDQLPHLDAAYWSKQKAIILRRLERLVPPGAEPPGFPLLLDGLERNIDLAIFMLNSFDRRHFSMVHGNLYLNNIVVTEQGPQALDWALAHTNVPVVDFAYMLSGARLSRTIKARLAEQYFDILGGSWPLDQRTLLHFAMMLHRLYLIDWQSRMILLGIAPENPYLPALLANIQAVARAF